MTKNKPQLETSMQANTTKQQQQCRRKSLPNFKQGKFFPDFSSPCAYYALIDMWQSKSHPEECERPLSERSDRRMETILENKIQPTGLYEPL